MDRAPKVNSTLASLVIAALAAGAIAVAVEHWRTQRQPDRNTTSAVASDSVPVKSAQATPPPRPAAPKAGGWSASASGRVEPRGGEVRIGAQMPGKVVQLLVRMNDSVKAGDLLVRLADDEPAARVAAATAETAARRRERDNEQVAKLAADRRNAEDAVAQAERSVFRARTELDRLQSGADVAAHAKEIEAARAALLDANSKLEQERASLRRVQAQPGVPLPTRLEAALTAARAELALAEATFDRTRIRAPVDGTVLHVNTHLGETVSPSPEDVLLVFGDLSQLKIRAEIEERDIGKIRVGQGVVVRSDAFAGQDFQGRVERMANALGSPRIIGKGPRRPNDRDVLQVLIDLDGRPPLVPGMRVDVFFKPDESVGAAPATAVKSN